MITVKIYDEPETELANDDQAADDHIVKQFRKEFMNVITSQHQQKSSAMSTKAVEGAKVND